MNRKQFLDKFEKHLRKYKELFLWNKIIGNIQGTECPLPLCKPKCYCLTKNRNGRWKVLKDRVEFCTINKDWPYQSCYYETFKNSSNLKNQMIAKVNKVYKITKGK